MPNDDPEAAERLVAILTPLITEQSCGEWDDKTINEDVQMFLPPLLAALQEARNAALREAANIVRGEVYLKHYRTWVIWPPYDDLPQERPNVSENHGMARHCDQLADAILTLIDTPAPPAEPAGDAQPITMTYRNWCGETGERTILPRKLWFGSTEWHPEPGWLLTAWDCDKEAERVFSLADCQFAALAAAPAPIQPAPQPVAEEREALVDVILDAMLGRYPGRDMARAIADALLAAGWTRK